MTKEFTPSVKVENPSFQNKPVSAEVTVPAQARYNIPTRLPMALNLPLVSDIQKSEYENIMPNGPSALYSEMRELLQNEGLLDQEKRGQVSKINEQSLLDIEKKLNIKLKPNIKSRYSHAPIIRNDNRELPFSPHAYFNSVDNIPGVSKSTLPENPDDSKVNIVGPTAFMFNHDISPQSMDFQSELLKQPFKLDQKVGPDPRWFQWQKGLAMVSGGTYTNTHSNTLQRNDPGTVNANTHVSSSQGAKTGTKISSPAPDQPPRQVVSDSHPFVQLKQMVPGSNHVFLHPSPDKWNQQPQAAYNSFPYVTQSNFNRPRPQQLLQIPEQFAAMRDLIMQYPHGPWQHQQQQPQNPIHFTQQSHQWGYGNGQGNGNGIGTPSASGSGGGWGAGGPLSQNMNLPGWSGGGDPPHSDGSPKRTMDQLLPPNARELWNQFVAATKRQSQSTTHVYNTNVADSSISMNTQSVNSGKNVKVQGHQYGFGNGNGNAQGYGNPGGSGNGGGWGAGGPTYQNTWLPGQQRPRQTPLQQKSMIHSSSLQLAIANSFTAPWLLKNNKQVQNAENINYGVPNAVVNAKRSQIPRVKNLQQTNNNIVKENFPYVRPGNIEGTKGDLRTYRVLPSYVSSNHFKTPSDNQLQHEVPFLKRTNQVPNVQKQKKTPNPSNFYTLPNSHEVQKSNYGQINPASGTINFYGGFYNNQPVVQRVKVPITKPDLHLNLKNNGNSSLNSKSVISQSPQLFHSFDPNFAAAKEYMSSHVTLAKLSPFSSLPILDYRYEPLQAYLTNLNLKSDEESHVLSLAQINARSQINGYSSPVGITRKNVPLNVQYKNKQLLLPQAVANQAYSLIKSGNDRLVQSDTGANFVSVNLPQLSNSEKLMMMKKKKRKKRSETSKRSVSSIR